jgi:hypothetical protein
LDPSSPSPFEARTQAPSSPSPSPSPFCFALASYQARHRQIRAARTSKLAVLLRTASHRARHC